jgi:choline dehydrogenase-like flavoprotein
LAPDSAEPHDYVVVGGGMAGCVVAARLAEGGARVLLLEAGPASRHWSIRVPSAFGFNFDLDPLPLPVYDSGTILR